jgi:hypothetical protein
VSLRTSVYLDRGDQLAGRYEPPRPCRVITIWRPAPHGQRGGPCNIAVRYLDDGSTAVIPFARRLKRAPQESGP